MLWVPRNVILFLGIVCSLAASSLHVSGKISLQIILLSFFFSMSSHLKTLPPHINFVTTHEIISACLQLLANDNKPGSWYSSRDSPTIFPSLTSMRSLLMCSSFHMLEVEVNARRVRYIKPHLICGRWQMLNDLLKFLFAQISISMISLLFQMILKNLFKNNLMLHPRLMTLYEDLSQSHIR